MKAYKSALFTFIIITTGFIREIGGARCPCDEESETSFAISQCSGKHRISSEAFDDIVNHKYVSNNHEVKCWLSCLMKKLGMMKEGKIDWELCKNLLSLNLYTKEDMDKVDKIAEICQEEVSQEEKDECQLAYSAAVCKIETWKKLGLPQGWVVRAW